MHHAANFLFFFYVCPSSLASVVICTTACTLPISPGFCCCCHCERCSSHGLSVRMFFYKCGSERRPLSYRHKQTSAVCRRTCSLVHCKYDEEGSAARLSQATIHISKERVGVGLVVDICEQIGACFTVMQC